MENMTNRENSYYMGSLVKNCLMVNQCIFSRHKIVIKQLHAAHNNNLVNVNNVNNVKKAENKKISKKQVFEQN